MALLYTVNASPTKPHPQPPPPPAQAAPQRGEETPLDQSTQFLTRRGLHRLYEPEAADKWIPRKIEANDGGGYRDTQTGALSQEDAADRGGL